MVIKANSTPTGNSNLGCGEKENFIQCKTAQLWYSRAVKTAQLCCSPRTGPLAWLDSSALLLGGLLCYFPVHLALCWSTLLCSGKTPLVFQLSQGDSVFSLWWEEEVWSQSQRGAGLYGQKSLHLVPDWSLLMQIRTPNPNSLIGPKGTAMVGQNRASLVGWSCEASIRWEKPQFYWLN